MFGDSSTRPRVIPALVTDLNDKPRPLYQFLLLGLLLYFCFNLATWKDDSYGHPFVGKRSKWEPTLFLRMRYLSKARKLAEEGTRRFKNQPFWLRNADTNILILPRKYLDELNNPAHQNKLSAVDAQVKNLVASYTKIQMILRSTLHLRAIRNRITPNLGKIMVDLKDELSYALDAEMPRGNDWAEITVTRLSQRIIARLSGRAFVGLPVCRNEQWIALSVDYAINVFVTAFLMKQFPSFLHPIVAWFIPSRYSLLRDYKLAEKLLTPLINDYNAARSQGLRQEMQFTILTAMLDDAVGTEGRPSEMAARQLILTLASITTTANSLTGVLFDLCLHPEYRDILLDEIAQSRRSEGPWSKEILHGLPKMDSVLCESMRMAPPSILLPIRYAKEDVTLSDGIFVPKGCEVGFASATLMRDPDEYPDPDKFDGLRNYRKRQQKQTDRTSFPQKHLLVRPEHNQLIFGYGKQACPGRFFAGNILKMALSQLLESYEFKLPDGQGKPGEWAIGELSWLDPKAKLLVRRK